MKQGACSVSKKWQKWLGVALAATLTIALVAGCGGKSEPKGDANEIRIGASMELTGGVAAYGQQTLNGIKLAVKQANDAGGINGKKINLIVADNKSEASEATNSVTKLINQDKVIAVLGPVVSSNALAALPVAESAKVPLLTPTATNPDVTVKDGKVRPYAFRSCFIDPFQGTVVANFAAKTLGAKKAAIYVDNSSDYSKGLAKFFEENFVKNGGTIVIKEAFLQKDQDFKSTLTKIKAAGADVIYVPGYYEEVGKIVKQAREMGITIPITGGDGWDNSKLPEVAGAAALNNTFFSNHYSAEDKDPNVSKFVEAYKKEYNEGPSALSALGYDAGLLLVDALKRAGSTDSAKLTEALAAVKNLQVSTGIISLDANHNPVKSAVIIEMKDGKQTFKEKVNP